MSPNPPLKWAGGKRSIIHLLNELISSKATLNNKFIDAFAGAGSVTIEMLKHFDNVIFNDFNKEVVDLMNVIKNEPEVLLKKLEKAKKNNTKEYFLDIRKWDRMPNFNRRSTVNKAMRTIYMNKTCFNGLYRVNSKGQFNVPYGKYENPNICDVENITTLSTLFNRKNISFENHDYSVVIEKAEPGDVVYLDPPYDQENPTYFIGYNSKVFDRYDQERLCKDFERLTQKGVYAIMSNSATSFIKKLYSVYLEKESYIKVRKSVGANGNTRKKVDEILITNFKFIEGDN